MAKPMARKKGAGASKAVAVTGEVLAKADAPRATEGGVMRPLDASMVSYSFGGKFDPNVRAADSAQGWFGPLQPMRASAPAAVMGRKFDFPSGYNLNTTSRPFEIGFAQLRGFAEVYDVLRLVIETRKDQLSRLKWAILPVEEPDAAKWQNPPNQDELMAKAKQITTFLRRPDRKLFWNDWLRELLEDLLVIDAPTIWKRRTRGGALWSLEIIDGATIKPVIDDWGRLAQDGPAYQQILHGLPAVNYTAQDIVYAPRNRRAHKVYGFSAVEQIMLTVNIALKRQMWQLQHWTEGNIPEALIGLPETWTPDQIATFQDHWDALLASDTAMRRRARFVPGTAAKSFTPTHVTGDDYGKAEEWLARVVCYAFGEDVTPFINQPNRATAESAAEEAVKNGLAPIQAWVKTLMDALIWDEFGEPGLEFKWQDDAPLDPTRLTSMLNEQVSAGLISINEARADLGKTPLKGRHWDVPMVKTGVGYVPVEPPAQSDGMGSMMDAAGENIGPPPPPEGYTLPNGELAQPPADAGTPEQKPPTPEETEIANAITDGMQTGDFSAYNKTKEEQEQAAAEAAAQGDMQADAAPAPEAGAADAAQAQDAAGEPDISTDDDDTDPDGGGDGGGGAPAPESTPDVAPEGAGDDVDPAVLDALAGMSPEDRQRVLQDAGMSEDDLAALAGETVGPGAEDGQAEEIAPLDTIAAPGEPPMTPAEQAEAGGVNDDAVAAEEMQPAPQAPTRSTSRGRAALDRLETTAARRRAVMSKVASDARQNAIDAAMQARMGGDLSKSSDDPKPGTRGAKRIDRHLKVPEGVYQRGKDRETWNLPRMVRGFPRRSVSHPGANVRDEVEEDRYYLRVRRDHEYQRDRRARRAFDRWQEAKAMGIAAGAANALAARAAAMAKADGVRGRWHGGGRGWDGHGGGGAGGARAEARRNVEAKVNAHRAAQAPSVAAEASRSRVESDARKPASRTARGRAAVEPTRQIGRGRSKDVFEHPRSANKVVVRMKRDPVTEAFLDFARDAHARKLPIARHLPKPSALKIDGDTVTYEAPRLAQNTTRVRIGRDENGFFLTGLPENHPQRQALLDAANAIEAHLKQSVPNARYYFDMGPQNFMLSSNGSFVINDPVELGGAMRKRTKSAKTHAAAAPSAVAKTDNPFGLADATVARFTDAERDALSKAVTGGVARRIAARIGDGDAANDLEKLAQRTDAKYRAARRAVGKDRAR